MLRLRPSSPRGAFILLLLVALAFLGNLLAVDIAYSVAFLFGSVAALLVALLYGPGWALGTALAASAWTYVAWGHPWGMVIFGAEAFLVGLAWQRTRWSVVLLDILYWLLVGMPLVAGFYLGLMDMEPLSVGLVMCKQAVNGVFNAVIVSLIVLGLTVRGHLGARRAVRTSEVLFALLTAFVFIPALLLTLLHSRGDLARMEERLAAQMERTAEVTAHRIDRWYAHHASAVAGLAERAGELGSRRSEELQATTAMVTRTHPDFHNMYVADEQGITVAFHPPRNDTGGSTLGLDFSDRAYFEQLRALKRPVVSRVFVGRGGVTSPIVTLSVPILEDGGFRGFALGALHLERLGDLLQRHAGGDLELILVSPEGRIIASSDPEIPPMRPMPDQRTYRRERISHHVQRVEPRGPDMPSMVRERRSSYMLQRHLSGALPWTLVVRVPTAPFRAMIYSAQARSLSITLAFAVLAVFLAWLTTRWVGRPLARLARTTRDLPDQVTAGQEPDWPQTAILEIESLIDTFRAMATSLRASFHDIQRHSEELGESNSALQKEIAERRQVEEALREGEGRLRALLEAAPFAVLILDEDDRIVEVNVRAATTFGGTEDDLVGLAAADLIADYRREDRPDLGAAGGAGVVVLEREGRRRDGTRFPAHVSMAPVSFSGSSYVMTTALDVTEHQEFKARVQEQDRLAAVGQLAGGIAHDFNNLLTVVLGFAQMLMEREDLPRDARDDLGEIASQAERAAQLVRQILDFSRRSVVERRPVELTGFVRDAVAMLERTLPESIIVEVGELPPTCWVVGSAPQLQQALTNLALNARDAMHSQGRLRVDLTVRNLTEQARPRVPGMPAGRWAVLEVSDTGEGMTEEVQDHIFEPFFTTKAPDKGTGLGLAQVHGIVKQHAGEVVVESRVGLGTTFSIFVPCLPEAPEEEDLLPTARRGWGRGQRLLLVEDEAQVREVLARMLDSHGYRVVEAKHGREALERHAEGDVDLVITDMVMPVMDGPALVEALHERDPDLPIIAMSGYPLHETPGAEADLPVSTRLQKPVEMHTLFTAVDAALRHSAHS